MTEVQEIILGIFHEVSEICENHNICYYAIGGTCLGAVRHKGFIPWDDDLDIAIPIEQYEFFIEKAKEELPEYLSLWIPGQTTHGDQMFIKVCDNRTTMIENDFVSYPDCYCGVWLDIMPISGLPSLQIGRTEFAFREKMIWRFSKKIKSSWEMQTNLKGKVLWLMLQPMRWFLSNDFFWRRWLRRLEKYPLSTSKYTGYVWALSKLNFEQTWFEGYVYMDFEDTQIRCPVGWHEFLTQMFGNYMEFPPEDQRSSGHNFDKGIVDLEHSYLDYQSGKLQGKNN